MKLTSLALPTVALAIFSFEQVALAQEKLLPPTYVPGKEYVFENTQHMEMDMSGLGQAAGQAAGKMVMDMTFEITATCENHGTPGQKKVTTEFSRVVMDMNSMGMEMTYDSAKEGSEKTMLAQQGVGKLAEAEIVTIYDENDEVVKVEGLEEMGAGAMFNEEQFKQMSNPAVQLGFPAGGVGVGDTWENDVDMNLGGNVGTMTTRMDLEYTKNEEIDGAPCGVVEIDGDVKMEVGESGGVESGGVESGEAESGEAGAAGPKMEAHSSELSGVMKMDKDLRFIREGEVHLEMKIQVPTPTDPTQTFEVPAVIDQRMSLKSVKDL